MTPIDIDQAIRLHTLWRRQFLNAFAGGAYADMPLSEHRSCMLGDVLHESGNHDLLQAHRRFHALANDIIELSNNGLSGDADLLLPELTEASHQLVSQLDRLRTSDKR